jgi:hypothetical protein
MVRDFGLSLPHVPESQGRYADFARRANLSRTAAIDLTPKSVASFPLVSFPIEGGSRSSRTLGMGCDGRTSPSAIIARTNGVCADGEVVWFWRSNAGAKVVKTLRRLAGDGGNQAWSPGSTKDTVKTIVQGMPAVAVYPWLLTRVLFAAHAASGATRIRHSLRPLLISRAARFQQLGHSCRETEDSCRQSCRGHPSRRGEDAAPQDEVVTSGATLDLIWRSA